MTIPGSAWCIGFIIINNVIIKLKLFIMRPFERG